MTNLQSLQKQKLEIEARIADEQKHAVDIIMQAFTKLPTELRSQVLDALNGLDSRQKEIVEVVLPKRPRDRCDICRGTGRVLNPFTGNYHHCGCDRLTR